MRNSSGIIVSWCHEWICYSTEIELKLSVKMKEKDRWHCTWCWGPEEMDYPPACKIQAVREQGAKEVSSSWGWSLLICEVQVIQTV